MISEKTAERIDRNYISGRYTVIGRYTYKLDDWGFIIRCKTCDVGRQWIDADGNQIDAWELVSCKG